MLRARRRRPVRAGWVVVGVLFFARVFSFESSPVPAAVEPPLEFEFAAPGFVIHRVAGNELAHDIQCMTLDAKGRIVVSGPGYIRTLVDDDGDGRADRAIETLTGVSEGAQGLLADASGLYFVGGGGLQRIEDRDGDGRADGPPRSVYRLKTGGEHHSHAVRRGPDGFLYWIVGNHAGFGRDRTLLDSSPVMLPYAGLLLRLNPESGDVEVIAQGMRNAYDFAFDRRNEIFAWDSDGERDEGLPWYRPCRLYHLTPGADCGWRSSGSGKLPIESVDTVPPVAEVGRGSPTGVAVYAHRAFPERYRGGLFALDWTFGRVLFFPLEEREGTFSSKWETFASSSAATPFGPTDIEIAPDGSLVVSSGGRGLVGSVYRIAYRSSRAEPKVGAASPTAAPDDTSSRSPIDLVLRAPAPESAWSRARWVPLARELSPEVYVAAIEDRGRPETERLRALDLLSARHRDAARRLLEKIERAADSQPRALRAQAAWWSGRLGRPLARIAPAGEDDARVLRLRLEAVVHRPVGHAKEILALANHSSRRVRYAATVALSHIPSADRPDARRDRELIASGLAELWRSPWGRFPRGAYAFARRALDASLSREAARDALRLVELCFERLQAGPNPSATFYESWDRVNLAPFAAEIESIAPMITGGKRRPAPSAQAVRLLGLLQISGEAAAHTLLDRIDAESSPGEDLLTLSYLARLPGAAAVAPRAAAALVGLAEKVAASRVARDQRWHRYVAAVASSLFAGRPEIEELVVDDPRFGVADHAAIAASLSDSTQARAAKRFLARPLPDDPASRGQIVSFLSAHPSVSRTLLLEVVDDPAVRAVALRGLARDPTSEDRGVFRDALESSDRLLADPAVSGLIRLGGTAPGDEEEALVLFGWIVSLAADATQKPLLLKIEQRLGQIVGGSSPESGNVEDWTQRLIDRLPARERDIARALREFRSAEERVREVMRSAPWANGDAARGMAVFVAKSCQSCHHVGGRGVRLGPDLKGIGKRFTREDLVVAIGLPNRQVADRYRSERLTLTTGEVVEGRDIYDSAAALLFLTRDGRFLRLSADEIETRERLSTSLMPTGLLDSMTPAEVSDIVAYLRSI